MLTVTDNHKTQRTAEAVGNVTSLSGIWSGSYEITTLFADGDMNVSDFMVVHITTFNTINQNTVDIIHAKLQCFSIVAMNELAQNM